jgi:ribosomal protein S6--L-glutamate ligase
VPHDRKRVITLVSGFGWHVRDLHRAALSLNIELRAIEFSSIVSSVGLAGRAVEAARARLTEADGIVIRMMPPGSLEQVVYRMDALHRLESERVPLLNPPRAVEVAVDKYLALALMERAGLSVPPTVVAESAASALSAFDALGGDVVLKPLFGSEGRGLVRLSDRELASRAFHAIERIGSVLYVQKTVRHPGFDTRVFVLGKHVVGAFRRFAPPNDWRTNVAIGGRPEACDLDQSLAQIAIRAAHSVGAEMAGVDILMDEERSVPVVLEVNAVPGWRALAKVTGVDVAAAILGHLRELIG